MSAISELSLAEQFREPGTPYLSPSLVANFFGLRIQELAERAHVHRNTPTARPHAQQLQTYLQDLLRVLVAATELTGDSKRAAFLIRKEPLRPFGYRTADSLIQEGRVSEVVAYLESLGGGAVG